VEGRLLSSCRNGNDEHQALAKVRNVWHKVAKLQNCFSCSLAKFLNPFQSEGYLTCYQKNKRKVLHSVFIVVFFYNQTKFRLCFDCFFQLLYLVCICMDIYILLNLCIKLFSVVPGHFLVSY